MAGSRNYGSMNEREIESNDKINETDEDVAAPEKKSVDILGSVWCLLKLAIPLCLSSASWVR